MSNLNLTLDIFSGGAQETAGRNSPDISRSLSASMFFTQFGQMGEQSVYTEHCGKEVATLLPFS